MAILVTPPTVEPMTAAEVKLRLKYPRADQDEPIEEWIKAARGMVERYVERGLLTQTWRQSIGRRTGALLASTGALVAHGIESTESHRDWWTHNVTAIRAPRAIVGDAPTWGFVDLAWAAPPQAIESVTDDDGIVAPTKYALDDTVEPARLWWLDGATPCGVVTIVYRIGYGDTPDAVPSALRQAVFALVQQLFLYRAGPPPQSALDETLRAIDGFRVRVLA